MNIIKIIPQENESKFKPSAMASLGDLYGNGKGDGDGDGFGSWDVGYGYGFGYGDGSGDIHGNSEVFIHNLK